MALAKSTLPVRMYLESLRGVPVGKDARKHSPLFTNQSGGVPENCGSTGPRTPSAAKPLQVSYSFASHAGSGTSSSSINATYSPDALAIARLRAREMLCSGSHAYNIFIAERFAQSSTRFLADCRASLSTTMIE